jgi:hypothetical protein
MLLVSMYRRAGELKRALVAEGMGECEIAAVAVTAPVAVSVEVEPTITLAQEYEAALEQRRESAAVVRWYFEARAGRLEGLDWWSLENARPHW